MAFNEIMLSTTLAFATLTVAPEQPLAIAAQSPAQTQPQQSDTLAQQPVEQLLAPIQSSTAEQLAASLAPYNQFQASFNQQVTDATGLMINQATGTFTMAQPAKLFWQQNEPSEQTIVSNGSTLWLYDADFEQVTIRDMSDNLSALPATIFAGDAEQLASSYIVTNQITATGVSFQLLPRQQDAQFKSLVVSFNDQVLTDMIIEDFLGQVTNTSFEMIDTDAPIDLMMFEYSIPSGTEIIDDRT